MNYTLTQLTDTQLESFVRSYGPFQGVYDMQLGDKAGDFRMKEPKDLPYPLQEGAQYLIGDLRVNRSTALPLKNSSSLQFYCAGRNYGGLLQDKPLRFSIFLYDGNQTHAYILMLIPATSEAKLYCFS